MLVAVALSGSELSAPDHLQIAEHSGAVELAHEIRCYHATKEVG
jgi:hypothetical protein